MNGQGGEFVEIPKEDGARANHKFVYPLPIKVMNSRRLMAPPRLRIGASPSFNLAPFGL